MAGIDKYNFNQEHNLNYLFQLVQQELMRRGLDVSSSNSGEVRSTVEKGIQFILTAKQATNGKTKLEELEDARFPPNQILERLNHNVINMAVKVLEKRLPKVSAIMKPSPEAGMGQEVDFMSGVQADRFNSRMMPVASQGADAELLNKANQMEAARMLEMGAPAGAPPPGNALPAPIETKALKEDIKIDPDEATKKYQELMAERQYHSGATERGRTEGPVPPPAPMTELKELPGFGEDMPGDDDNFLIPDVGAAPAPAPAPASDEEPKMKDITETDEDFMAKFAAPVHSEMTHTAQAIYEPEPEPEPEEIDYFPRLHWYELTAQKGVLKFTDRVENIQRIEFKELWVPKLTASPMWRPIFNPVIWIVSNQGEHPYERGFRLEYMAHEDTPNSLFWKYRPISGEHYLFRPSGLGVLDDDSEWTLADELGGLQQNFQEYFTVTKWFISNETEVQLHLDLKTPINLNHRGLPIELWSNYDGAIGRWSKQTISHASHFIDNAIYQKGSKIFMGDKPKIKIQQNQKMSFQMCLYEPETKLVNNQIRIIGETCPGVINVQCHPDVVMLLQRFDKIKDRGVFKIKIPLAQIKAILNVISLESTTT